jgi:hypothetical protein
MPGQLGIVTNDAVKQELWFVVSCWLKMRLSTHDVAKQSTQT